MLYISITIIQETHCFCILASFLYNHVGDGSHSADGGWGGKDAPKI
jgi:hypothetical protein